MEVLSVDKQFPNVITVSIKERREIYYIEYDQKYYVTTEDGFVLNAFDKSAFSGNIARDKILLKLNGVDIVNVELGSFIKTDNDDLMRAVFEMAKSAKLTDCIKDISILKVGGYDNVYDVTFKAYTGVEICIEDVLELGTEKVIIAFDVYDNVLSDYQKTFGKIETYVMNDGEFRVTYNQQLIDMNR